VWLNWFNLDRPIAASPPSKSAENDSCPKEYARRRHPSDTFVAHPLPLVLTFAIADLGWLEHAIARSAGKFQSMKT
jgi:hypothetical protein